MRCVVTTTTALLHDRCTTAMDAWQVPLPYAWHAQGLRRRGGQRRQWVSRRRTQRGAAHVQECPVGCHLHLRDGRITSYQMQLPYINMLRRGVSIPSGHDVWHAAASDGSESPAASLWSSGVSCICCSCCAGGACRGTAGPPAGVPGSDVVPCGRKELAGRGCGCSLPCSAMMWAEQVLRLHSRQCTQ